MLKLKYNGLASEIIGERMCIVISEFAICHVYTTRQL